MKNKKADIPIIILVVGIVALCILAILSFNFSLSGDKDVLAGLEVLEKIHSIEEKALFYKNIGFAPEEFLDVEIQGNNYVVEEESKNSKGELLFSVKYVFAGE